MKDEYLRTFHLTRRGTRASLQLCPTYVPPWPPVQLGPLPPMPSAQPAPMAPAPVPLVPVAPPQAFYPAPPVAPLQVIYPVPPGAPPAMPPQVVGQGYPPGWGAPMPPYGHAPVQPYLNAYPPAYWPPYLPHYAAPQGGFNEDSEMAKPDKFTGWDPSKLHPFIVSCVMAFDSRPCKFATDRQRVSFAVSYLSDIAMLWWQPTLVAYPKPS